MAHARAFQEMQGIERPVLVDDVEGTLHRAYGLLPNMTYLVNRAGRVLFRSDWTDPDTVQAAVDYVLHARNRRKAGTRLKPFYSEFVGYRWTDDQAFISGLDVAGPQAVDDFRRAMQRWAGGAPIKGALSIDET